MTTSHDTQTSPVHTTLMAAGGVVLRKKKCTLAFTVPSTVKFEL